ncbi:MAG: hypothetical protein ACK6DP_05115 [Gemmatimonas sp.]|jgi:uncharacterized protein (DUF1778 family)|uniref:hypothetical protein n=1 Tax=Gemmatimonas sp. TaxID=1962908 RepID=UPI00391EF830
MSARAGAGKKGDGAVLVAPLSVVLSVDERRLVREAAFQSEMSVSAFIRAAAVKAAQRVARQALRAMDRAA